MGFLEVNFRNFQNTQNKLKNAMNPEQIKSTLIRTGFKIEAGAKRDCPVLTARLRSSLSTNWDGSGMSRANVSAPAKSGDGISEPRKAGNVVAIVRVGTNVEYAIWVHEGTGSRVPNPFLYNAASREIRLLNLHFKNAMSLSKMF